MYIINNNNIIKVKAQKTYTYVKIWMQRLQIQLNNQQQTGVAEKNINSFFPKPETVR
jgi:hypothetical protein